MNLCPTNWFYLAEIYRIQDEHPEATLSLLAEGMGVSLQAASRMIRRMAEQGMIVHEPYKYVTLTPDGERIALQMIRRHRILEAYLVEVMGFGWDEVHAMCVSLERGMTDKLIDRMNEMAGRPRRCPHGEPIPTEDGHMPHLDDRPLSEWPLKESGEISRIKTHDEDKLRYLAEVGLTPGVAITVNAHSPFDGPLHVHNGGQQQVIGYQLATEIYIQGT